MKHFWHEKWLGKHTVCFFGNGCGWKLSVSIGVENHIVIFGFCIGVDFEF